MSLRAGVEWAEVAGEVVVLDLASSAYLGVNSTGAVLWPLVVRGTTEAELADALVRAFDIDEERARADAQAFVARLRSHALVD